MSDLEKDLKQALMLVRNLRQQAVIAKLDPWAVRQALWIALELDRQAAKERGVAVKDLEKFDLTSVLDARAWAEKQARKGSP